MATRREGRWVLSRDSSIQMQVPEHVMLACLLALGPPPQHPIITVVPGEGVTTSLAEYRTQVGNWWRQNHSPTGSYHAQLRFARLFLEWAEEYEGE